MDFSRVILLSILAGLVIPAETFCAPDGGRVTSPIVLGFDNKQPFNFPPLTDEDSSVFECLFDRDLIETNKTLKFKYPNGTDTAKFEFAVDEYVTDTEMSDFVSNCEDLWTLTDYISQASQSEGVYNYVSRSLCFQEFMPEGEKDRTCYNDDLAESRAKFIFESCIGGDYRFPADKNVYDAEELSDAAEQAKALAEDAARKLTFAEFSSNPQENSAVTNAALARQLEEGSSFHREDVCNTEAGGGRCNDNAAICVELKGCYENEITKLSSSPIFKGFADNDNFKPDNLVSSGFMYNQCWNITYSDLLEKKNAVCASSSSGSRTPVTILDGDGGCETLPVCPTELEAFFLSFEPDYPKDESSYGAGVASIKQLYFTPDENGSPAFFERTQADAYGYTLIVKISIQSAKLASEVFKNLWPHDLFYVWKILGYIGNSITLGALETILEQADMHDGLVDGAEMEAVYENTLTMLDGSASVYDEVVCRCAEEPRRGHGCDGIDNDCDKTVDECDEDAFPPIIDVSDAVKNCGSGDGRANWFSNKQSALDCVALYTSTEDDCDIGVVLGAPSLGSGTCDNSVVEFAETRDRCSNLAVSPTVSVFIDENAPDVTCWFGSDTQTKLLSIPDTGAGVMTNTGLVYNATDNCGGDLDVKVDVFSNEIEDFNNQEIAILFQNTASDGNDRAGLYIASQFCPTSANGQCIKDSKLDTRLYTVVVSATDAAGNLATDTCQIIIDGGNPGVSMQRFFLNTYSSIFSNTTP